MGIPAKSPLVGVNAFGRRVGESHPKAELSDHDVELMREMHESERIGYRVLARLFEVPVSTAQGICIYRVRSQVVVRWKPRF